MPAKKDSNPCMQALNSLSQARHQGYGVSSFDREPLERYRDTISASEEAKCRSFLANFSLLTRLHGQRIMANGIGAFGNPKVSDIVEDSQQDISRLLDEAQQCHTRFSMKMDEGVKKKTDEMTHHFKLFNQQYCECLKQDYSEQLKAAQALIDRQPCATSKFFTG